MRFKSKKKKIRLKSLGVLSLVIFISVIINTPLFTIYNITTNDSTQENNEKNDNRELKFPRLSNYIPNADKFNYYKTITIDHTKVNGSGSHNNFPVLISIIDSDLDDKAQYSGNDIAFANSTEWIDHEIELFNPTYSATEAQLIAWVRIPVLFTSIDTSIFMFYGNSTIGNQENPTGVWGTNYEGVWHLVENPDFGFPGDIKDSTTNGNHGTAYNMEYQDLVSGQIDGSFRFNGINEYVSVGNVGPEIKTIDFWMNPDTLSTFSGQINTGYQNPTETGETYNAWTNPTNAYSSDNSRASMFGFPPDSQDYYNFNFNIPGNALISGIEVSIEGRSGSSGTSSCRIRLSWDGGTSYTNYYQSSWYNTFDQYKSEGGSTNTWGKIGGWVPSEFSNANFRVWLDESGSVPLEVDHLRVRVYYSLPSDLPVIDINGINQLLIDKDGGNIKVTNFPGTTNIYVNGTTGTKVDIGNWYHIVITDTTGVDASSFNIARNSSEYFDGIIDEVRLSKLIRSSDWIATEYNNQYDPNSFYSISEERSSLVDIQVNALDLYGNTIPDVNISMIQDNTVIRSALANASGAVSFEGVLSVHYQYNFTVSMTSNIEPYHTIEINRTSDAILIEDSFQVINLICNISRNIFNVVDVDGISLDSGWIIVANYTDPIQNCSINENGKATFRWLNNSVYNYTLWYRDVNYNPNNVIIGTGDILKSQYNSEINVTTLLTTVNFTLLTKDNPQPVDGAKLILGNLNSGENIVNLTTDLDGKASFRWLNSSGINSNYSIEANFYGKLWDFEIIDLMTGITKKANFTVISKLAYNISIILTPSELEEFESSIVNLNPKSNIQVEWGSIITISALFNVSKVPIGYENLTGPTYADQMSYTIFEGSNLILSRVMPIETYFMGRHYSELKTNQLETSKIYLIKISAQKSGYVLPPDIFISLYLLENELTLNQSENIDSAQSIYWQENTTMSVKPYGILSEDFGIKYNMYNLINGTFNFTIPSISNQWKLSRIVFYIYNITFGDYLEGEIHLNITDDYGVKHHFNSSWVHYYHSKWATNGSWSNLEVTLNKKAISGGDSFNFTIDGTYVGDVNVIATAYFMREKINVQYLKYNVTESLTILTEPEGWAIQNITFVIYDSYNYSSGSSADLSTLSNLNITTNEGYTYSLNYGDANGNGILTIDDRILLPLNDQFLFTIKSKGSVTFNIIINVEYIQEFYKNQFLENINISKTHLNYIKTDAFQVRFVEKEWVEDTPSLMFNGISTGLKKHLPSDISMTITIAGEKFNIEDISEGQGIISLEGFEKDSLLTAFIETNLSYPILFYLSVMIDYSRIVSYEIRGIVNYTIIEKPEVSGEVQYYEDLGYYSLPIDTSSLSAFSYTVRFTITKENYISSIKDLKFIVLERLTLLNGSSDFFRTFKQIYVMEPVNFTLSYTDSATYQPITNLNQKKYLLEYYDNDGNVIETRQGSLFAQGTNYTLDIDTEKLSIGEYLIIITLDKDNYEYKTGLITLTILKRPTLINGVPELSIIQENIYVGDQINFSFSYIDERANVNITNLGAQSYLWKEFNATGNLLNNGTGTLISSPDNLYILDFDTEIRNPGNFEIVFTLDKENYTSQTAIILLSINLREFSYTLSDNFKNNQISIPKGEIVVFEIRLIDMTRNDTDLIDSTIVLSIKDVIYTFQHLANGIYRFELSTKNIDTFFTSKIISGIITISKENFVSEEFSITIVVKMEEIFPGIPTLYFILGLVIIVGVVGSIVGYRIYINATTPRFVKKVREMQKAIEYGKIIPESLLYRNKISFIGERVKNKWDKIGLSLADILGTTLEKEKLERKISDKIKPHDRRPYGILLMRWDDKIGTEFVAKYPENIEVSSKTLMQVYSTHEYTGEKGIVTLMAENLNILSYYTGPDQGYYLLLFLDLEDDPDLYENGMPDILRSILENLTDEYYIKLMPLLFQRLSVYPTFSEEQILAYHYQNEITRIIINILRDNCVITKSELTIWLKDKHIEGFFDLEAILSDLIKMDILKVGSIKGLPSELIFLTKDLFMLRTPPTKLLEDPVSYGLPSQFLKEYPKEVKEFFQDYQPSEEDNINIIEAITTPQVYEVFRLLRTSIATKQDLEKLKKRGVDDIYEVLKILWDNKLIKVFHDEKNDEYYALLTDFYIDYIFPKYLLKFVKTAYEQKSKVDKVLLEYLHILEKTYIESKSKKKPKD